jgi:hypothetical protein
MARALPREELLALTTPSGYERVRERAPPAAARPDAQLPAIPNPFWFEATFPYATPSLLPGEASIVVPQYIATSANATTGVFVAGVATGEPVWAFQQLNVTVPLFNNITYTYVVPFGRSRSSAAVDAQGSFFVGADLVCGPPFDCSDTEGLPALFAFKPTGAPGSTNFGTDPVWVTNLGLEATVPVGSASPVLREGLFSEREVYFVSYDGTIGLTEGEACPTTISYYECSNHGVCDCATGLCACSPGYCGADCSSTSCGASGGGNAASGFTETQLIAAVGGPIGFALVLVALLVANWRSRNPGAPLTQMLPNALQDMLGVDRGESEHGPLLGVKPAGPGSAKKGGFSSL